MEQVTEAKHLKPRLYYSDLYDKGTVEECRRWESTEAGMDELKERHKKAHPDKEVNEKELLRTKKAFGALYTYFISGERYEKKEEAIRKWMSRDEELDRIFETAKAPEDIICLTCGRLMFETYKHLDWTALEDRPTRVLFMYDCPLNHFPRRAFYNDGTEWLPESKFCSKCKARITEVDSKEGDVITITSTCSECGNVDTREIDLTPTPAKEPEVDPHYDADRARFCLSDEKGQEYIQQKASMKHLTEILEKSKEKEKEKDLYDKVATLKKLKIAELEEHLSSVLEKAGYIKLSFKTPEITKDVVVPFITYESKPDREGYRSTSELEKLLRKTLIDTNWRLMSDGTSYRLGMLEGRLKGYEREEDLVALMRAQEKKEDKGRDHIKL